MSRGEFEPTTMRPADKHASRCAIAARDQQSTRAKLHPHSVFICHQPKSARHPGNRIEMSTSESTNGLSQHN